MAEAVRVLHVLGNTQLGGAESRIMDLYRHMDRQRVQFDFLVHQDNVHQDKEGYFDQEIYRLGGRIFRVPRFKAYNYFSYRRAVRAFFKEHHEFQVVQGHITSTAAIYLPQAKKAGIPVTAAHARSAGVDQGPKGILTRFLRRNLADKTDVMFTCSQLAGIAVFGKRAVEQGRTIFVPNAIECQAFDYNEEVRKKLRKELGIEQRYVIGHVGSFRYAKNHEYLLRVFASLCGRREAENSSVSGNKNSCYALLLLGEGGGMDRIKELARELGVEEQVYFLGNRSNVKDYYQAMDYFVYPSRFEGLPGAVVEAQTAGLYCLISDTICREVMVTDLVHAMDIQDAPEKWAEHILKTAQYAQGGRKGRREEMQKAGFDVNTQVEIMTKFYETGRWDAK